MTRVHPWDFGIKPSDYLKHKEHIGEELQFALDDIGVDTLDASQV